MKIAPRMRARITITQKWEENSGIQRGAQPAGAWSGHFAWPIALTIGASGPNWYSIWLPEITTASGVYANRNYVTGRPTLIPRYYGGYGTGGQYGAYAAGGYPGGDYGVYANRSYVTGRPTLFPRYYGGGWGW